MTAPERPRLVLVDDDALFLKTLSFNFEEAGFAVDSFTDGNDALNAVAAAGPPAALVLDWQMPALDGLEILRRLRNSDIETPVMFLTGLVQPLFEELALDQGAVDFVEKSRSFSIILKRLQLVLAGAKTDRNGSAPESNPPAASQVGPLTLKAETKRALWNDAEVALSLGEYEVVAYLAQRTGNDISYREIYDLVRGHGFAAGEGTEGYRANVRAMIKRIRKKFADVDPRFEALENYPGFGYRWRG